ncbi:MAG TPA: hypothetical protein VGR57_01290, partial [Ktedonobacterales bacterium]|nr:hypothetical protein [Ktedonobacterales bacterium]
KVDGLASGCTLTMLADTLAAHLPEGPPADASDAHDDDAAERKPPQGVLLVGHEPDFSEIIGAIVGRKGAAALQLKKGALCRVDLDPTIPGWRWSAANLRGAGRLAWLLTARQLGRLGAGG